MPARKPTADQPLLMALACGATVEAAARQADVSVRTAYRRLADPAFQAELQKLRTEMVVRSAAMLTGASMTAVKTLVELQATTTPYPVRLGAAKAVLELGMKYREMAELERQIEDLRIRVEGAGR